MKYFRVHFDICPANEAFCDILCAEIAALGFESFENTPEGVTGYIPQNILKREELDLCLENFPIDEVGIRYNVEETPDENWNATWEQEGFRPIKIDDLICVHDTRVTPTNKATFDISINPCLAFGTGSHETTRMLLRHLADMDLTGKHVIDAGTGTGILAIMCRMKGAGQVLAYDIDEWSVRNARDNARLNGMDHIEVREGDSCVLTAEDKADLIIANINRNILLADMGRFRTTLRGQGQLLMSGFYPQDIPMLTAHAATLGMKKVSEKQEGDWAMLLLEADATGRMDV